LEIVGDLYQQVTAAAVIIYLVISNYGGAKQKIEGTIMVSKAEGINDTTIRDMARVPDIL